MEYSDLYAAWSIYPDVSIIREASEQRAEWTGSGPKVLEPVTLTAPMPEEHRENYLTLVDLTTRDLITVIDLLSPSNKRASGDGRREYLKKREALLQSRVHLVELDLLREGERLPTVEPLPFADFYALTAREERRPKLEVYHWTLRDPLPILPIPLKLPDDDAHLPLQTLFEDVFAQAGYAYSLNYNAGTTPPLDEAGAQWLKERLASWNRD